MIPHPAGRGEKFKVPGKPAFYRLIVAYTVRRGQKLGTFGFYFRVVSPTMHAKLTLDARSYRPGEAVIGRLENLGTATLFYGVEYTIEKFDGANWSRAPESPHIFPLPLHHALPGTIGESCGAYFQIPEGMPPGQYRVSKPIEFAWPHPRGVLVRPKRASRIAEFEIAL